MQTRREAALLSKTWRTDPRGTGLERPGTAEEILRPRGSVAIRHALATMDAPRRWRSLLEKEHARALGALTDDFDAVRRIIARGTAETSALDGPAEPQQFRNPTPRFLNDAPREDPPRTENPRRAS